MIKATGRALKVVQKGDKVILTGGFAAAPSAIAAILKGCDLYLHEQNSVMGLVNRIFARFSKKVFLSFENTKNAKGNCIVTGNPVREVFYNRQPKKDYSGNLLILGGSQGSRKINKLISSSIDEIVSLGFNVTHQCGAKLYDETKRIIRRTVLVRLAAAGRRRDKIRRVARLFAVGIITATIISDVGADT